MRATGLDWAAKPWWTSGAGAALDHDLQQAASEQVFIQEVLHDVLTGDLLNKEFGECSSSVSRKLKGFELDI